MISSPTTNLKTRVGQNSVVPWLFSLPAILMLLAFLVTPFVIAVIFSFTNLRLLSPIPLRFVGLQNYVRVFQDPIFYRALGNNLLFALIVVPVQTALALELAVLVNRKVRGVKVFRTIYFAPVGTVIAVSATVWRLLYDPDAGFINGLPGAVSGRAVPPELVRRDNTGLPGNINKANWQGGG